MKTPVKTVSPFMEAAQALQFAEDTGVHHLPLVEHGQVRGLVCTCDLEELELRAPISRAVRRPPVTVSTSASIADAMATMAREAVGSVLVLEGQSIVGIVTREDLNGIDWGDVPGFRCSSCGSVKHLKSEGSRGTLCLDCRSHAGPETPFDETSVGD
ncbi:MAG TPA: CBS domain-containing protein [Polyangiaceae bacterium]|nr:CBS domain-containing protein [Polyangiaceae bacterium]